MIKKAHPMKSMTRQIVHEAGEFALDARIQLWVLLPISVATLLMALLRRTLSMLWTEKLPESLLKVRDAQTLGRAANLRISPGIVSYPQFAIRQQYFGNARTGALCKPQAATGGTMTTLMSPQTLANQVTGLMSTLVPQMVLGAWARYLFSGVAVCRLPFSLSERFRGMLQSGMEAAGQNVGVHYVSALSWYLLNLFGNAAVVYVLTYSSAHKGKKSENIGAQLALNMNPEKVFKEERNLVLGIRYSSLLEKIEKELIES